MDKIIHTGFFSPRAAEVIKALIYNSHAGHNRKWTNTIDRAKIDILPNNEVVISGSSSFYSWDRSYWNCSNTADYIAKMVKDYVIRHSNKEWRRDSHCDCAESYYDRDNSCRQDVKFKIAEAYLIYEMLLKRKNFIKKYDANLVKELIGEERDPIAAELESSRRAEVARLKEELEAKCNELRRQCSRDIDEYRQRCQAALDKDIKDLKLKYKNLIDGTNETFSMPQVA